GIFFGIKQCGEAYTNYDFFKIIQSYFNERLVIRLVATFYSVEGDMRIVILKRNPKESYRLCYISFILQSIKKGLSMFC
ncbi:hypothetical protein HZS_4436, partial [Henneguya salminicola]